MPKDYSGQPETADGYSVVANEYLEALYKDPLVELRTRIRFYIQRWTWGYGVKTRDLSQARMAKEIGAHRSHLNRAIKELVASKRINVTRKGNKKKLTFSINKYYRQWIDAPPDIRDVTQMGNKKVTQMGNIRGSVPIICKEKVCKERVKTAPPKPKPKPRPKKKKFVPPELGDVQTYFTSNGYTLESALKFFNYYAAGEWHDGNGKPVKNWKQKAIAVWFKEENKVGSVKGKSISDQKYMDKRTNAQLVREIRLKKEAAENEARGNPPVPDHCLRISEN